mmetsp:Transcript_88675/g.264553  ORF Transcript_88675/g.264553 Transcript_88675/m.264553 type:complete len:222 (-) Transcript_88675:89-754(-)
MTGRTNAWELLLRNGRGRSRLFRLPLRGGEGGGQLGDPRRRELGGVEQVLHRLERCRRGELRRRGHTGALPLQCVHRAALGADILVVGVGRHAGGHLLGASRLVHCEGALGAEGCAPGKELTWAVLHALGAGDGARKVAAAARLRDAAARARAGLTLPQEVFKGCGPVDGNLEEGVAHEQGCWVEGGLPVRTHGELGLRTPRARRSGGRPNAACGVHLRQR